MPVTSSEITIEAPVEIVWAALTRPDLVKRWQYGADLETDWSVGSPIRFVVDVEGHRFEQWGEVVHVEPPRELRYSLFAPRAGLEDTPENRFEMVYSLAEEPGGTVLTVTQDDPRPIAATPADGEDDDEDDDDGDDDGEDAVLLALKQLCESRASRTMP